MKLSLIFPDYELIVDSDILPNRTAGPGWSMGGFDNQEPAQFEERHLIFLQQLGKVPTPLVYIGFHFSLKKKFSCIMLAVS